MKNHRSPLLAKKGYYECYAPLARIVNLSATAEFCEILRDTKLAACLRPTILP